jgi:CDP-diacylglycerol--glycerol-3-phosphate 3-phosphatidyltransferase
LTKASIGESESHMTIPNLLSVLRMLLVPVLLALAWAGASGPFLVCLALSFATDILDGWTARRLGLTTRLGATLDSWADLLTYSALILCTWWLRPDFVRQELLVIAIAAASYFPPIVVGLVKYRRLISYHTRLAKLSACAVGATLILVFAGGPSLPFRIAVVLVVLASIEELAMTVVLPSWQADVPTLLHALQRAEARARSWRRTGEAIGRIR